MNRLAAALVLMIGFGSAYGDTLSCPSGKELRCLGFSEKVVKNNSICFDALTCDQGGFVCKSKLDGLADEHEALVNKHNELVGTYNELLAAQETAVKGYESLERCVKAASTLEDAKGCL